MNPGASGEKMTEDTQCWPTPTSTLPPNQPIASGFYSPGLECPAGYTSACTAVSQTSGDVAFPIATPAPFGGNFQFALDPGETAVGCCPNGYACAAYPGSGQQLCSAAVTSSFLAMDCVAGTPTNTRVQTVPFATVSTVEVWAPLIQINWRSEDRQDTAGGHATTVTSRAPTAHPFPPSSALSSPRHSTSSGLSTAAKAAISVSIVSAVILVLSIIIFFCVQRRKRLVPQPLSTPYNTSNSKILSMSAFSVPLPNINQRSEPHMIDSVLAFKANSKEPPIPLQVLINTDGFGRGLKVEDDLESPIDDESPFRLKRFPTKRSEKGWGPGISAHPLPDDTDMRW